MEQKSIHEMDIMKTTHTRLLENGILFQNQIPRRRYLLKKMGFTDRQIVDLWENFLNNQ